MIILRNRDISIEPKMSPKKKIFGCPDEGERCFFPTNTSPRYLFKSQSTRKVISFEKIRKQLHKVYALAEEVHKIVVKLAQKEITEYKESMALLNSNLLPQITKYLKGYEEFIAYQSEIFSLETITRLTEDKKKEIPSVNEKEILITYFDQWNTLCERGYRG